MSILCEKCKKKTATVYVEKITNGHKSQYNLCSDCAQGFDNNLSLDNFLKNYINVMLSDVQNFAFKDVSQKQTAPLCKKCGMTYDDFKQYNRLGCTGCYDAFSDQLNVVYKSIQNNCTHDGKVPARVGSDIKYMKTLDQLKRNLSMAIEKEEYEEAAILRDQIRELNKIRND